MRSPSPAVPPLSPTPVILQEISVISRAAGVSSPWIAENAKAASLATWPSYLTWWIWRNSFSTDANGCMVGSPQPLLTGELSCPHVTGDLSVCSHLARLTILDISLCNIDPNTTLDPLSHCPSLVELRCNGNFDRPSKLIGTLDSLQFCTKLRNLQLQFCDKISGSLVPVKMLYSLATLDIRGCQNLTGSLWPLVRLEVNK